MDDDESPVDDAAVVASMLLLSPLSAPVPAVDAVVERGSVGVGCGGDSALYARLKVVNVRFRKAVSASDRRIFDAQYCECMPMQVLYMSHAAPTDNILEASHRNANVDNSNSFMRMTSSLSQSDSSNTQREMQFAIKAMPSLTRGKLGHRNP